VSVIHASKTAERYGQGLGLSSASYRRFAGYISIALTNSLGLTNNVFWVIILSAALDLVGPAVPKATVLLVSVTPALGAKVITPYVMHRFPYGVRIITLATLCALGTLTVASSQLRSGTAKISATLAGIALGSIAGGIGEVNFLSMGHHYGAWSLSGWSSGESHLIDQERRQTLAIGGWN
jgi:hypothetical protein